MSESRLLRSKTRFVRGSFQITAAYFMARLGKKSRRPKLLGRRLLASEGVGLFLLFFILFLFVFRRILVAFGLILFGSLFVLVGVLALVVLHFFIFGGGLGFGLGLRLGGVIAFFLFFTFFLGLAAAALGGIAAGAGERRDLAGHAVADQGHEVPCRHGTDAQILGLALHLVDELVDLR